MRSRKSRLSTPDAEPTFQELRAKPKSYRWSNRHTGVKRVGPMNRVAVPDPDQVAPESKKILDVLQQQMGRIPNVARVLAVSPSALTGWFELMKSLNGASLDAETRNGIALAVSQMNGCHY